MPSVRKLLLFLFFISVSGIAIAQDDLPKDYLSKEFHMGRRAALREKMPENSVFVVFAFPTRTFSNDVDYLYHQNPDLYYFSGYKEPHSMLLVFKETQTDSSGNSYDEILFVQQRNPMAEQWTGRRLGVEGAKEKLGFKTAFNGSGFQSLKLDFNKFSKVIMSRPPIDVPNNRNDRADLYDLMQQFAAKINMPADITKDKRFDTRLYQEITADLRGIKTAEELVLLRKAVEISCMGQAEVMRAVRPDMSELEIQGIHEYVHKKYGAEGVGYGSIIGAGENGCILHYMENTKTKVGTSMLLMDVGAEYHGYSADVTRTVPVDGKFSPEEKAVYQLVYEAQEAVFKMAKEGAKFSDIEKTARQTVVKGLVKLGIAKDEAEANKYYPHGCSHHIGLDVHDRGSYTELKKGMVITVEPGIYIPSDSKCDPKWWGIAVRIEDDILIKEKDNELLSVYAPRKVEDIEKMIAEKSVLNDFKLPKLKSEDKKGF